MGHRPLTRVIVLDEDDTLVGDFEVVQGIGEDEDGFALRNQRREFLARLGGAELERLTDVLLEIGRERPELFRRPRRVERRPEQHDVRFHLRNVFASPA